jgi:Uri superfamily endonuclease
VNAVPADSDYLGIPKSPGVYILHLVLPRSRYLRVGKLGSYDFLPGDYFYIGSASGPGGLRARLGRHLHGSDRRYWHIDWLRQVATPKGYFYLETRDQLECAWNQTLARQPGACIPVPGFGASDCKRKPIACAAHLHRFELGFDEDLIRENLPAGNVSKIVYRKFTLNLQPDYGDIG